MGARAGPVLAPPPPTRHDGPGARARLAARRGRARHLGRGGRGDRARALRPGLHSRGRDRPGVHRAGRHAPLGRRRGVRVDPARGARGGPGRGTRAPRERGGSAARHGGGRRLPRAVALAGLRRGVRGTAARRTRAALRRRRLEPLRRGAPQGAHDQPRFEAVRIDLEQPFAELRAWLPLVLPGSEERLDRLVASLAVRDPRVLADAVEVTLAFAVEPRAGPPAPEPALTPEELRRWEERWQRWDAFLTFVVKRFAGDASGELREAVLAVLLDARYDLLAALAPSGPGAPDPVPALFVRTWERLAPVLRREARGLPAETALRYTSFIAAGDALAALTRLGPEVGLDISADGLRRLARMVDPTAPGDPVAFSEEVDPELRRLFGFRPLPPPEVPAGVEEPETPAPGGPEAWLEGTAWAAGPEALASWLPDAGDLEAYLARVRSVLERAQQEALDADIAADLVPIYHRLVPATAWQESCWRQFVRARGRIVPLESAVGSVGIMQVNVHVWRGLYAPRGLHWDVAYNARARAEILLYYFRDAARGDRDPGSLVRATYAMYNAGPQARRTRSRGVARVAEALWQKYEALGAEGARAVAACLGA